MAKSLVLASAIASLLLTRRVPDYFPSLPWTFLGLSSTLLTALVLYRVLLYPLVLSPVRHLPTVKGGHWLLGQFLEIYRNPTGMPQIKWVEDMPENDGLIRYMGMFNAERIMPCSPKTLSEVLHQKSYAFVKPDFMRHGIGRILGLRGLLFAEGDEHRQQRKMLLPAFSHSHIKNLVPTFWGTSRELVEKLGGVMAATESQNPVIEMAHWCSLATLDIIGRAGFGYEFRALETEDGSGSELAQAYKTLFTTTGIAITVHVAQAFLPGWFLRSLPLRRNKELKQAAATVQRVSLEIVTAKKLAIADKNNGSRDILSTMLRSGDYDGPDGVDAMRDQMMTFLAAGHETTATAMMWGLHLLSLRENHHIQSRLRDEIRAAFPHGLPEDVTYEQIESLKYLRDVTTEVLRVFPPVALTARHAAEDTSLGGQFIPKGSHIVIVPMAVNRNKDLWGEDASVFRPERWEEGGQAESNYAFMTFLAGPRGCIGNVFAKVEYKCLMAALIGMYPPLPLCVCACVGLMVRDVGRFEFAEEVEGRVIVVKAGITAKPQGGIPLKVTVVPGW